MHTEAGGGHLDYSLWKVWINFNLQDTYNLPFPSEHSWIAFSARSVGRLVGRSVSWSVCRSVGRLVGRSGGRTVSWSVGGLVSWLVGQSVGQLVSWSVSQSVIWMVHSSAISLCETLKCGPLEDLLPKCSTDLIFLLVNLWLWSTWRTTPQVLHSYVFPYVKSLIMQHLGTYILLCL